MVFTLTDTSAQACKIEACSESQVFSIGDAGTNCVFAFSVMSPHSPYPFSVKGDFFGGVVLQIKANGVPLFFVTRFLF